MTRRAAVPLAVALLLAVGREAAACPSCYGQAEGPLLDGARSFMWVLLGLTLALQGGFAAFFLYLRRQAARARDRAIDLEWSRLQGEWDGTGRSGRA